MTDGSTQQWRSFLESTDTGQHEDLDHGLLAELLAETKSYADADYRMVADYAASLGFEGELMPWDWA